MSGHVLLVFFDSRLARVTDVPHLRTPFIKSLLPVLHNTLRTQSTVALGLFFTALTKIAVLRFQLAWTCLPRSLLLPSKSWVVAVERDSLPLLSSVCNLYLIGATASDGTFTNKSSTYTCPSCQRTGFLLLPVHDVRLVLPDEQVVLRLA